MQKDFHYYATYCAAILAGYSHEESLDIGYASQFVDMCSKTLIGKVHGPLSAATTQLQMELADTKKNIVGRQDITRIWSSFHFLPYDLSAHVKRSSRAYLNKYRLICRPNGELVAETVRLAKNAGVEACGVAMHVLADTWAHANHAGTPSLVINDSSEFFEIFEGEEGEITEPISFVHKLGGVDDVENGVYTASLRQMDENSIMNLGHGRDGHLPDYSYIKYKYLPAWGNYEEIIKDNPSDYYFAFCQMVYALRFLKGYYKEFKLDQYDEAIVADHKDEIMSIIRKRQVDACNDWKAFGEKLSGCIIEDFDVAKYQEEYVKALNDEKNDTFLGRFFMAAMNQKSMVTNKIFKSGNLLAGFSVDFNHSGFAGIKDFGILIKTMKESTKE